VLSYRTFVFETGRGRPLASTARRGEFSSITHGARWGENPGIPHAPHAATLRMTLWRITLVRLAEHRIFPPCASIRPFVRLFRSLPLRAERWRPGSNADQMCSSSGAHEDTQIARGMVRDSTSLTRPSRTCRNSRIRSSGQPHRDANFAIAPSGRFETCDCNNARRCRNFDSTLVHVRSIPNDIVFYQFAGFIELLNIAFMQYA